MIYKGAPDIGHLELIPFLIYLMFGHHSYSICLSVLRLQG